MKKIVALFLSISIFLSFSGCIVAPTFHNTSDTEKKAGTETTKATSEQAKKELLRNSNHECLDNGTITFENSKWNGSFQEFWFEIAAPGQYCTDYYKAVVSFKEGHRDLFRDCDIRHVRTEADCMGIWEYRDEDVRIWVNLISREEFTYKVEYEVMYYKKALLTQGPVSFSSNGIVNLYSSDTSEGYLEIELKTFDEAEGWIEAGWLAIYSDSGVYWNAINEVGGPYKLNH